MTTLLDPKTWQPLKGLKVGDKFESVINNGNVRTVRISDRNAGIGDDGRGFVELGLSVDTLPDDPSSFSFLRYFKICIICGADDPALTVPHSDI
jgi:hypothetical protein